MIFSKIKYVTVSKNCFCVTEVLLLIGSAKLPMPTWSFFFFFIKGDVFGLCHFTQILSVLLKRKSYIQYLYFCASYHVLDVYSHNSSRSLNTHVPPSVSLSVIGLETDLIVWMCVSQTGQILLYLWLLYLLLTGIYWYHYNISPKFHQFIHQSFYLIGYHPVHPLHSALIMAHTP